MAPRKFEQFLISWAMPISAGVALVLFERRYWLAGMGIVACILAVVGYLALPRIVGWMRLGPQRRILAAIGETASWYVELNGRRVAILNGRAFHDMFWESYRIEPTTDDQAERLRLLTDKSWWLECTFTLRSSTDSELVCQSFPAGDVFNDEGRVVLRTPQFEGTTSTDNGRVDATPSG